MTPLEDVETILQRIGEAFSSAELAVFAVLAKAVKEGVSRRVVEQRISRIVTEVTVESRGQVRALMAASTDAGLDSVREEVRQLADLKAPPGLTKTCFNEIAALERELSGVIDGTGLRILRYSKDAFREVAAEAVKDMMSGSTRRKAAQAALDRFAMRGIPDFVDAADRTWNLVSYTEMMTRTGCLNAQRAARLDAYAQMGEDLVIIDDSAGECGRCRPWEGRVLSISGSDRRYASVVDARAGGLFHPHCKHHPNLYIAGTTRPLKHTADPQGNAAREQQRYLERGIRRWKRREAASIDDVAKAQARARVREWQARLRQHVDQNGLKRLRYREQIRKAI